VTIATDPAAPRSASPTAMAQVTASKYPFEFESDENNASLVARMVRVMYPHERFGDAPYHRSATAILEAAGATPALKSAFATALHDLKTVGFADLDDKTAYEHLRSIETTDFFMLARSTAIVTLYDDHEVWTALGYEGSSFEKGGYIHRGFNDLDWLPDPRIDELEEGE
jgi:hypothetical protein